jgi:recombination protein RecA
MSEKKKTKRTPEQMDKIKKVKLTMDKIDKDFGKGTIMALSEKPSAEEDVVSTGCLGLDNALGIGGLPRGRIVEIYGPESAGKTTIAAHVIAEVQKLGGLAAMIDAEHAFDPVYAKKLGVDVDNLLINQPDYGEQGLEVAHRLIASGGMDVIVIDSVAALVPKGELEGAIGDQKMGLQARLMGQTMRMISGAAQKNGVIVIFINQLREKIGVMFGSPETTPGGNALKFYASVRLDIRKIGQIKDGEDIIGNRVRVKVVKNKLAPPYKSVEFDLIFGEGVDAYGDLVDQATALEIVKKSGSWFSYGQDKLGQGRDTVIQLLKDNPGLYDEILDKTKMGLKNKK